MFGLVKKVLGIQKPARQVRIRHGNGQEVRAGFAGGEITDDNRRHWAKADGLSGNAWSSPEKRFRLRNRSRHEVFHNSYAKGIVETLANDTIGIGPRLQMQSVDPDVNAQIESAFTRWCENVRLADKLRRMRKAKCIDGKVFGVFGVNPGVVLDDSIDVPLDIRLFEADQVATPFISQQTERAVSGIVFDSFGNPQTYHFMRHHPGDLIPSSGSAFDEIPAAEVIHYFTQERPGQRRGVPELCPALELFAQLRRYTLAVLTAAELIADQALVAQSNASADEETDEAEPFDTIELDRGLMTFLPRGYSLGQPKAEQPSTTYAEFKEQILNEIARCINVPFNIAAGNSSKYNYASGRLDHQEYFKAIRIEQANIEISILDRIFMRWFQLAILKTGLLPQSARAVGFRLDHEWYWDGFEHVDPVKESKSDEIDLLIGAKNLAEICKRRGRDWEAVLRQRAREIELSEELGVPVPVHQFVDMVEEDDDAPGQGQK